MTISEILERYGSPSTLDMLKRYLQIKISSDLQDLYDRYIRIDIKSKSIYEVE